MTRTKDLQAQWTKALLQAKELTDRADAEDRDFTAEERTKVEGWINEVAQIKTQLLESKSEDELRRQVQALGEGIDLLGGSTSPLLTPVQAALQLPGKSIGDRFIESDGFKNWLKTVAPSGHIPESARGLISPPVEFKNLLTGADDVHSAGAFLVPDMQPFVQLGRRPLVMRNIVTNGTTSGDTVEFVRTLVETNNAAPVAEATATSGVSGTKPESTLTFEKVTETVKTIAHWVAATKRALSDVGQLRTLIDSFLRDGLEQELEDQMVNGDGIGENFTGIANTPGTQSQAWSTDLFETTRKAKTKVRVVGRVVPTGYLLNPYDWERIDLMKDGNDRYYGQGPFGVTGPSLWGLPVIESEAVTQGIGYCGDFRQAVLWDRESSNISVSDSHADFFVRNMIAILGELRAAFGVLRPAAFVEMDLTA